MYHTTIRQHNFELSVLRFEQQAYAQQQKWFVRIQRTQIDSSGARQVICGYLAEVVCKDCYWMLFIDHRNHIQLSIHYSRTEPNEWLQNAPTCYILLWETQVNRGKPEQLFGFQGVCSPLGVVVLLGFASIHWCFPSILRKSRVQTMKNERLHPKNCWSKYVRSSFGAKNESEFSHFQFLSFSLFPGRIFAFSLTVVITMVFFVVPRWCRGPSHVSKHIRSRTNFVFAW